MGAGVVYLVIGVSLVLAVVLPVVLHRFAVSAPMVLLGAGALLGLLPGFEGFDVVPADYRALTEHLTELCVLVALMGTGLALDRPLDLRSWESWRAWGATWRLLGIAMPLTILGVALLGWWVMGLSVVSALLLGSVLAPTDPVLASDVQVGGPSPAGESEEEIDERDEVRFALTSEAGLNDGLAFPFVQAAILLAAAGGLTQPFAQLGLRWLAWDLAGRTALAVVVGCAVGWVLARMAFRFPQPSLRMAETGEPLLALATLSLCYGLTALVGGYGFVAVFCGAMTLRSAERGHAYHAQMHQFVERLERLLTLVVLLLLGVSMANGLLRDLTWGAVVVGCSLVFLVRPAAGLVALRVGGARDRVGDHVLSPAEQAATAFFGVRGVGSLYYVAFATGQAGFEESRSLWSAVAFAVALSVVVHGVSGTPAMRWLERRRE